MNTEVACSWQPQHVIDIARNFEI